MWGRSGKWKSLIEVKSAAMAFMVRHILAAQASKASHVWSHSNQISPYPCDPVHCSWALKRFCLLKSLARQNYSKCKYWELSVTSYQEVPKRMTGGLMVYCLHGHGRRNCKVKLFCHRSHLCGNRLQQSDSRLSGGIHLVLILWTSTTTNKEKQLISFPCQAASKTQASHQENVPVEHGI